MQMTASPILWDALQPPTSIWEDNTSDSSELSELSARSSQSQGGFADMQLATPRHPKTAAKMADSAVLTTPVSSISVESMTVVSPSSPYSHYIHHLPTPARPFGYHPLLDGHRQHASWIAQGWALCLRPSSAGNAAPFLERVFSYLLPGEVLQASRVCRSWHSRLYLMRSRALQEWHRICIAQQREQIPEHSIAEGGLLRAQDSRPNGVDHALRATVVHWMMQLVLDFDQHIETQFLAIRLLDRVLNVVWVCRSDAALVGLVCFWIAAKLEEGHCPDLTMLLTNVGAPFPSSAVRQVEAKVLEILDFRLHLPHLMLFVKFGLIEYTHDPRVRSMAYYLTEQTLLYPALQELRASLLACTLLCYAAFVFHQSMEPYVQVFRFEPKALRAPGELLLQVVDVAPQIDEQFRDIYNAYNSERHYHVASLKPRVQFLQALDAWEARRNAARAAALALQASAASNNAQSGTLTKA